MVLRCAVLRGVGREIGGHGLFVARHWAGPMAVLQKVQPPRSPHQGPAASCQAAPPTCGYRPQLQRRPPARLPVQGPREVRTCGLQGCHAAAHALRSHGQWVLAPCRREIVHLLPPINQHRSPAEAKTHPPVSSIHRHCRLDGKTTHPTPRWHDADGCMGMQSKTGGRKDRAQQAPLWCLTQSPSSSSYSFDQRTLDASHASRCSHVSSGWLR